MNYLHIVDLFRAATKDLKHPAALSMSAAVAIYSRTLLPEGSDLDILCSGEEEVFDGVEVTHSSCGLFSSKKVVTEIRGIQVEYLSELKVAIPSGVVTLSNEGNSTYDAPLPGFHDPLRMSRRALLEQIYIGMGRDKDKAIYHKLMDSPFHAAMKCKLHGKTMPELIKLYGIDPMAFYALNYS